MKDVYVIRTDAEGNELWSRTYGGAMDDEGAFVEQTTDGGCFIAGYTRSSGAGDKDFYVIKLDDISVGVPDIVESSLLLTNYPNPFSTKTTIKFDNPLRKTYTLKINDITCKTVRIINDIRDNKVDIYRNNLPVGLYTIELRGENIFKGKIIISE